jgi:prepilin-type N-terminal cleavage/methylation domain-containing protein
MVEKTYSAPSPCSPSSADGFSLIELLIALLVTSVLAGAALGVTLSTRRLVVKDQGRHRVDQDLRIGLDLVGIDIRQAGERLPADFPAIEVVDGAAGAPDTLIIRRNLLGEVLPVCEEITEATTTTEIRIAVTGSSPPQGCPPVPDDDGDTWPDNLQSWRAMRDGVGGAIVAYVYNPVDREGEMFVYDGDGTTTDYIHKDDTGSWQHTYEVTQQCRVYLIEERSYTLIGDVLEMTINQDTANPIRLLHGVTDFQVRALLEDGSVVDDLDADDDWAGLSAIDVNLAAEIEVNGQTLDRTVTAQFFPRNVLSL